MENRRKLLLIDKKFQLRFIFYVSSWTFALTLGFPIMIHQLFEFFQRYAILEPMAAPVATIYQTEAQVLFLLTLMQLLFFGVTVLVSLFISHRIAGPIYKLRHCVQAIQSKELAGEIRLRKTDYFGELAESCNAMVRKLHGVTAEESMAFVQVRESLQKISDELPAVNQEQVTRALKYLHSVRTGFSV